MMDNEKVLILAYKETDCTGSTSIPDCPVSEHITVALAVKRNDLLPNDLADPLNTVQMRQPSGSFPVPQDDTWISCWTTATFAVPEREPVAAE